MLIDTALSGAPRPSQASRIQTNNNRCRALGWDPCRSALSCRDEARRGPCSERCTRGSRVPGAPSRTPLAATLLSGQRTPTTASDQLAGGERAHRRRSARRSRPAQCLFALCRDGCSAQAVGGGQHPAELTSYPHLHVSLYTDPSCTVAIPPAHPRTGSDGDWRRRCRAVSPLCARPRS